MRGMRGAWTHSRHRKSCKFFSFLRKDLNSTLAVFYLPGVYWSHNLLASNCLAVDMEFLTMNSSSCGSFIVKVWGSWVHQFQDPWSVSSTNSSEGNEKEKRPWMRRVKKNGKETRKAGIVKDRVERFWTKKWTRRREGKRRRACRGVIDQIPLGGIYQPLIRCEELTGRNCLH